VIPNFITAVLDGRAPQIYGDGGQSRDFTFVTNVVEGNLLAMDAPDISGRAFNIAYGQSISLSVMLGEICVQTGRQVEAEYLPPRPGDVLHSGADISRAEAALGYVPSVSFDEGLRRTIDHFASLDGSRYS
jgi:UDP-glucose 4-epimerase